MSDFDFDAAVLAYYLTHGHPGTAKEIAEHSAVPIARVRKVITSSRYRSNCTNVARAVRERNYGTVRCFRTVDAYEPSLSMMRERILAAESGQVHQ